MNWGVDIGNGNRNGNGKELEKEDSALHPDTRTIPQIPDCADKG